MEEQDCLENTKNKDVNHWGAQKLGEKTNSKQHLYKSKKKANINVEILHRGQRWCVCQDMMMMMMMMMMTVMM